MRRLFSLLGLFLLVILGLVAAPGARADVNDFHFAAFDGQYALSIDDDGHSTLRTIETIVAVFPEFDQNRGIRRDLITDFKGIPTELTLESVTDETGSPRDYETETDADVLSVTIAAADYVHGEQTYVITYTQRYVTAYYADTGADEFYWDTNGTGWPQSFDVVSATVHVDAALVPRLTGRVDAASGYQGQDGPAEIIDAGDGSFEFRAERLAAGQNLTFAIGFQPGTFVPRDSGFFAAPWPALSALGAFGSAALLAAAVVLRRRHLADAPGRGTIIAQYTPPTEGLGASIMLLKASPKMLAAWLLRLAVLGTVRIVETGRLRRRFLIEYSGGGVIDADDREFLNAIFAASPTPGDQFDPSHPDRRSLASLALFRRSITREFRDAGYRRTGPRCLGLVVLSAVLSAAVSVVFGAVALSTVYGGFWPPAIMLFAVSCTIAAMVLLNKKPLTTSGAALSEYLVGLRLYIELAEADRIRVLQSPEGAERVANSAEDPATRLKLYERLLPYAVILGVEKEWMRELGELYEQAGQSPAWYSGRAPFSAAAFSAGLTSFSTSATSSYSSSSGGSSGGSSSGGGGGGGGGGGV